MKIIPKHDKLLHLIAGIYIYLIVLNLLEWMFDWQYLNFISLLITSVIGVGKELYWDKFKGKGTPEIEDAMFTISGAVSILILTL